MALGWYVITVKGYSLKDASALDSLLSICINGLDVAEAMISAEGRFHALC